MRGHVNAEALALCREGLLGQRRTARIQAHVARCPHCAEVDAGLAALPALLALTSVPPMPAELAARLDAVIATEARNTAAGDTAAPDVIAAPAGAAAPGASEPASGGHRPRSRAAVNRRVLAFAASAAAVVMVAAGGGYLLSHGSSPSESSASSAARPAPAAGGVRAGANAAAGDTGLTVISSGTDYRPGRLAAQVAVVLARYAIPAAGQPVPAGAADSSPAQASPAQASPAQAGSAQPRQAQPSRLAALPGCVARIAAGLHPRMVDEARYNGRPATIIVLPATAHGPGQVWAVGSACSGSRSDVLAHVAVPGSG